MNKDIVLETFKKQDNLIAHNVVMVYPLLPACLGESNSVVFLGFRRQLLPPASPTSHLAGLLRRYCSQPSSSSPSGQSVIPSQIQYVETQKLFVT